MLKTSFLRINKRARFMRNVLVAVVLAATTLAAAANPHHHNNDTAVALGIGVIVGAIVANRTREVVVYPPAPVYTPPPVVHVPVYPQHLPPMYRAVDVYIPECACTRTILVPVR